jgi:hypothetical protein
MDNVHVLEVLKKSELEESWEMIQELIDELTRELEDSIFDDYESDIDIDDVWG